MAKKLTPADMLAGETSAAPESPDRAGGRPPSRVATEDERRELKLRRNVGPACPLCGMPSIQRGKPRGRLAYYYCLGYVDPVANVRYPGCGHSFKRRQWTAEDVVAAIDEGRAGELRADAVQQIADRERSRAAIADARKGNHSAPNTGGPDPSPPPPRRPKKT